MNGVHDWVYMALAIAGLTVVTFATRSIVSISVKLVGANGTSSFNWASALPAGNAVAPPAAADSAASSERRRGFSGINRKERQNVAGLPV